jgi:hypothetical protein
MTFKEWLVKRHLGRDSRVGDLARDVQFDPRFPDTDDVCEADEYGLYAPHSSRAAETAVLEAYVKWRDYCDAFWEKELSR